MGTASMSILDHPCPLAKIDLCLLSRLTLHSPKRQWICLFQLSHETLHRIVAAQELLLGYQVLVNPLGGQPAVQTGFDEGLKRLAVTDSPRLGPGGRNGWFWRLCLTRQSAISSNSFAVDSQFASNPTLRPATAA